MIWFLTVFSLLFIGIDFAVYRSRIRHRSSYLRRSCLWLTILSYVLPVVALVLLQFLPDNTTGWMKVAQWIIFLYLLLLGCRLSYYLGLIFDRHRPISRVGLVLALCCAAWLTWGAVYGRQALLINRVDICSPKLPASFEGFRVVQFSDLHLGALVNPVQELTRLVDTINSLHPDLIVFSGDLVNIRYSELTPPLRAILQRLQAPYGVLSTLGNHDVGLYIKDTASLPPDENDRQVIALQRQMGWQVLMDSTLYLRRANDSISVSGISFDRSLHQFRHSFDMPELCLDSVYKGVPTETYNLTISHLPQLWPNITATGHGDLTLAGHVHSMQVKWRLFGRQFSPASLLYDQWSGRYDDEQGHTLYINDGIGYVGFPMRLGAHPEITVFTLTR